MRIGDYARYRCAYDNTIKIKKINAIVLPDNLIKENYYKFDDYEGTIEKCIIKSSPNIIDLIEVGDYVNGYRVDAIGDKYVIFYDGDGDIEVFDADIKSIVTHEEFESMEHEL